MKTLLALLMVVMPCIGLAGENQVEIIGKPFDCVDAVNDNVQTVVFADADSPLKLEVTVDKSSVLTIYSDGEFTVDTLGSSERKYGNALLTCLSMYMVTWGLVEMKAHDLIGETSCVIAVSGAVCGGLIMTLATLK